MKAILLFAWFAAGFTLVQWAFDQIDSPFQGAQKVVRKFAYFAAHKDEYDVVFVGSSRVMNQISPREFDSEMLAAARPCRSFNLGYAGMYLPECSFIVDQILALHPARLRTLVMELSNPAPHRDRTREASDREVYWHRLIPTGLVCAASLTDATAPQTLMERSDQICQQIRLLTRCSLHVGDGPDWLHEFFARRHGERVRPSTDLLGPYGDGFVPLKSYLGQGVQGKTKGADAGEEALQSFVAAADQLRRGSQEAPAQRTAALPRPLVTVGEQLVRRTLAWRANTLQRRGITPVFYIAPVITRERLFIDLHSDGTLPKLLAFNNPQTFPDLYDPSVRADRHHLNAAGAELLTRKLAAAIRLNRSALEDDPSLHPASDESLR